MELEPDIADLNRRMDGALRELRLEFGTLRTGRATTSMLDTITVSAYESEARIPINQLATVNVPEPRMIMVSVWDRNIVDDVVQAIQSSGLGINPVVEGTSIRLPVPDLTEERRQEIARMATKFAEDARVAIRNVRRDGMDRLKRLKAKGMSEDDHQIWRDEIQELTDSHVKAVDEALAVKTTEILKV